MKSDFCQPHRQTRPWNQPYRKAATIFNETSSNSRNLQVWLYCISTSFKEFVWVISKCYLAILKALQLFPPEKRLLHISIKAIFLALYNFWLNFYIHKCQKIYRRHTFIYLGRRNLKDWILLEMKRITKIGKLILCENHMCIVFYLLLLCESKFRIIFILGKYITCNTSLRFIQWQTTINN